MDSDDDNSCYDEEYQDDNFSISKDEQYKIANLFERLIINKNNIKFKELIKESIVKTIKKRENIENDDDLEFIENLIKKEYNKNKKVKMHYPKK